MNIQHKEFTFRSYTGICQIYIQAWIPENPKAILQIHHGMAEHSDRYADFATYLNERGYAVFIHDMANHAKSNQNIDELGYFGDRCAWKALIEDMKEVYDIAEKELLNLEHFVFGHSMGSLVVRKFLMKYASLVDGAILCGTGGKNPLASFLVVLTSMIGVVKGKDYRSNMIDKAVFGSYNDKFEKRTKFDWLSRNTDNVDRYMEDSMCGYIFTCAAFSDLAQLLIRANKKEWYDSIPNEFPIYLISGEMDPVGNYSKGVMEVYEGLKLGGKNVAVKLYAKDRHEILNEDDRELVFEDVGNWLDSTRKNKMKLR